jgi:hypothetical protein
MIVNARWRCMVHYLKSVSRELLPAWLARKSDVRLPPIRELVGAAPPGRYRGTLRHKSKHNTPFSAGAVRSLPVDNKKRWR